MNENMTISFAKYLQNNDVNTAVIDGQVMWVPPAIDNKEYEEIARQVKAGTLTIADAD